MIYPPCCLPLQQCPDFASVTRLIGAVILRMDSRKRRCVTSETGAARYDRRVGFSCPAPVPMSWIGKGTKFAAPGCEQGNYPSLQSWFIVLDSRTIGI